MMKIALFALVGLVFVFAQEQPDPAAPEKPAVTIVKQSEEIDLNKYSFEYETSDGTYRQEQGEYKNDTEEQGLVVRGSYKYTAPDGQVISVTFVADKDGYQPKEENDQTKLENNDDQPAAPSVPQPAEQPAPQPAEQPAPQPAEQPDVPTEFTEGLAQA